MLVAGLGKRTVRGTGGIRLAGRRVRSVGTAGEFPVPRAFPSCDISDCDVSLS